MKKKVIQADGKKEAFVKTRLDQIWGDTGVAKYKTLDLDKYNEYLTSLNKSDLQSHAVSVGIIPDDNRERLTKKLVKEFIAYASQYKQPDNVTRPTAISETARRILAEGR